MDSMTDLVGVVVVGAAAVNVAYIRFATRFRLPFASAANFAVDISNPSARKQKQQSQKKPKERIQKNKKKLLGWAAWAAQLTPFAAASSKAVQFYG